MTQHDGMPDNPGDPEHTDPEATSADRAEAAPELDPTLEADLEEALADIDADADGDGEISETEALLAERTEDLQRLNAEYANYRRRTTAERQALIESTKAKVLGNFLPILDDLDLARQHGDLEDGPLKAIADKLSNVLQSQNLEAFGAEGDAFDPEIHEAVQDLSTGGEQVLGTILRRGYTVGDKLVRTAMVIIADPAKAAAEESESESDSAAE